MANIQLPASIQAVITAVEKEDRMTPSKARQLLGRSEIEQSDLMQWADFEHPKCDSYGRKLLYNGGFFELMVMSWVDGDMSAIHDHGYAQWGAVKLFGEAEHAIFKLDNGELVTWERKKVSANSVVAVSHDLIHQMGNNGEAPYLTLHLYGSDDGNGDVTADARIYDLAANEIQFTDGGAFLNLTDEGIKKRLPGPKPDFPTWLRFHLELLKRLLCMNASLANGRFGSTKESRLAHLLFERKTWQRLDSQLAELGRSSHARQERYLVILNQELFETVEIQIQLLEKRLVSRDLFNSTLLRSLSAEGLSDGFLNSYLAALNASFNLNLRIGEHAST